MDTVVSPQIDFNVYETDNIYLIYKEGGVQCEPNSPYPVWIDIPETSLSSKSQETNSLIDFHHTWLIIVRSEKSRLDE